MFFNNQQQQNQQGGGGFFGQSNFNNNNQNQGGFGQNQNQNQGSIFGGVQQQNQQQPFLNNTNLNQNQNQNQQFGQPGDEAQDIPISNPQLWPEDSVSHMSWMSNNNMFACASWDGKIRIYNVNAQSMQKDIQQQAVYNYSDPVLYTSFKNDNTVLFAACGDTTLRAFDLQSGQNQQIGKHDEAVNHVSWIEGMQCLLTTSFDKTIRFWQLNQQSPILTLNLDHKIYCASVNYPLAFFGLSSEKMLFLDLSQVRNMNTKISAYTDNPLASQVTSLALFKDNQGFGIASCDGRAHLGSLQKDNYQQTQFKNASIMTFKCHKQEEVIDNKKENVLYPVHGLEFNSRNPKFVCTAGGDGAIHFWDYEAKNKIRSMSFKNQPVTSIAISPDGNLLAYALGYDWAKGIWGLSQNIKPRVFAHVILQNELKHRS